MAEYTEAELAEMSENMGGADYSIGDTYGGDFRFKLALQLIESGDLSQKEAENMLRWTEPSDSPEKVIGLIAGEFGASKREIAKALEGTEFAVQQADIEQYTRDFNSYRTQAGGVLHDTASVISGYMGYQTRAAGSLIRSGLGLEGSLSQGIGGDEGGLQFKEDSYLSKESGARREQRGTVADNVRAELDRLLDNGDISSAEYKRLKSKHAGNYGYQDYTEILDSLRDIYTEIGEDADFATKQGQQFVLRQLMQERSFTDDPELPEAISEEGVEDEVQTVPDASNTGVVDGAEDPYNFYADGVGAGVFLPSGDASQVQSTERAAFQYRNEFNQVVSADFIVDRSTGQTYSIDEWTLIKTDPVIRARYESTKVTAPAIQEILDRPFFSGTGPQIPIEDLGIPSASPTQPWETDTYDFKKGQASADWMSMTTRERTMRAKVMKDNGLISDDQWANLGGQEYGNTGIAVPMNISPMNLVFQGIWENAYAMSSTFQWSPISALGVMGDQLAMNRAPTRGYGSSAPKYSVPASLREVPDYKALATESRQVFRGKMGRDMEDWELALLSDELGDSYKNQNDQLIKLHRAAWEDAVAGGNMEVDYGEVEDPNKSLQYDIEEDYANELDRNERVEDRALSRSLLMDSITTGRRMIG